MSEEEIYRIINMYKNPITLDDIIMLYYARLLEDNVDDSLIRVNDFYRNIDKFETQQLLDEKYDTWITINSIKYDNDVTLLYKWQKSFQVPIKLMITRLRTAQDNLAINGTTTYIFESLHMIVKKLYNDNTPNEIYDFIKKYNKFITPRDLVFVYYILLQSNQVRRRGNPGYYYKAVNQFAQEIVDVAGNISYEDEKTLENDYNSWLNNINIIINNDDKRFRDMIGIQKELTSIEISPEFYKRPFSPLIINKTRKSFNPSIRSNGRLVTADDGLDIFNEAKVSHYIPFICYNDSFTKPIYKVFTEGKIENEPDYSIIIPKKMTAENTIYMTLWLGDPNNDQSESLRNASRESLFTVIYYLSDNRLIIESPIETVIPNEELAYQRTQMALTNLSFGEGNEIKVSGSFDIWNINMDETSFLDMVLTNPLMNSYLYVEESKEPFAVKKRLDIHYRSIYTDINETVTSTDKAYINNYASVSVTLIPRIVTDTDTIEIMDLETKNITKGSQDVTGPYIHVNILSGESRAVLDEFIKIFQLLMTYYIETY